MNTTKPQGDKKTRTWVWAGAAAATVMAVGAGAALLHDDPAVAKDGAVRIGATPPLREAAHTHPPDRAPVWDDGPPPVVLWVDGRDVVLEPWTACYQDPNGAGACMDGMPRPPYEDVGERPAVDFRFPEKGWHFAATLDRRGDGCGPVTVKARSTGQHTFTLPGRAPAGTYRVDLSGRGEGGDVVTSFRWTLPDTPGVTATC